MDFNSIKATRVGITADGTPHALARTARYCVFPRETDAEGGPIHPQPRLCPWVLACRRQVACCTRAHEDHGQHHSVVGQMCVFSMSFLYVVRNGVNSASCWQWNRQPSRCSGVCHADAGRRKAAHDSFAGRGGGWCAQEGLLFVNYCEFWYQRASQSLIDERIAP